MCKVYVVNDHIWHSKSDRVTVVLYKESHTFLIKNKNPGGCTRMQKEVISFAESIRRNKVSFSLMIEGWGS